MSAAALIALQAWVTPAAAQSDPEAQLRQIISDITSFVATQSSGAATLQTSRPPETRMDGGTAIATLPDVSIVGRRGEVIELGTLTLSEREVAPGRLRYELSLPQRFRVVDRPGATPVTATSGGGTLAVVRDLASGLLLEVDFQLNDLTVPPPRNADPGTTIALLQAGYAVSARADGLSDGVARFVVRGLRVVQPNTSMGASLGEFSMAFAVQAFHLDDLVSIRDAYFQPTATSDLDRWRLAMERLQEIMIAGRISGSTSDITLADGAYNDGGQTPAVAIARASMRQVAVGGDQELGTYQLRYEHDGLAVRQGIAPMPQYIPARVDVNLAFEQLPMRALHATGAAMQTVALRRVAAAAAGNAANSAAARRADNEARLAALMTLLQAMEQAGTTLRIAPIDVEAQAVGGTLNGSVTADPSSPLQARASGELVVRGLEALQRELGAQGARGADSPAGALAMLAALGQQGTGPNGQPVRTYRIELTAQGQLMLNGADMSALLGGPAGGGGRSPRPTPPARQAPPAAPAAPQAPGK